MNLRNKKVCILGLGYIGLPTAALLANFGYDVIGVDINKKILEKIKNGKTHIVEKDLDSMLKSVIHKKKLTVSNKPIISDIYIICVPTPFKNKKNIPEPDLQFINSAVDSISKLIKPKDIIILESTSPIGTTLSIKKKLQQKKINLESVSIAYCPERVLPGSTLSELLNNDRVVGGIDKQSTNRASSFYKTFVRGKIQKTNSKTAEMCKLIENSYRDLNIAFANEASIICEKNGVDVWKLIELANYHPRVNILQPGSGVGGHCIAVDPWFIVSQNYEESKLIKTAREVNDNKTKWVLKKIFELIKSSKNGDKAKIVCFGATFKPNIDDIRESPAIKIIDKLIENKFKVLISDPNIESYKNIKSIKTDKAIEEGDIFIFLVKHREFLSENFKLKFTNKVKLDFCGIFV